MIRHRPSPLRPGRHDDHFVRAYRNFLLGLAAAQATAQQPASAAPSVEQRITERARENRRVLRFDGRAFSGPAWDLLVEEGRRAQVFLLGEEHGIAVVGYSPFGHDDFPAPGSAQGKILAEIAAAHEATPRQAALAFLTRRASLFAIPKAGKVGHVEDNAGALRLALSEVEIARIDAAFPLGRKPHALPMI